MYKKVLIVFSIAVAVIFTLAACNRLAPQSPVGAVQATPTSGGSVLATPLPTGMSLMEAWGTSTAIYIQTEVATGLFTAVPTSGAPQTSSTANPAGTTSTPMVPPTGVGTVVAGIATDTPMPGTTPAVIVPTPTPGHPATYTLQSGEFPWCIARRFNVDPNELLSLNGLTDGQTPPTRPGIEHPHRLVLSPATVPCTHTRLHILLLSMTHSTASPATLVMLILPPSRPQIICLYLLR